MPNIELKAHYPDLQRAREILAHLGASFLWDDQQTDIYFHTRTGNLKMRFSGKNGVELLPHIKRLEDELRRSHYVRLPVDDAGLTESLLSELLGVSCRIEKRREAYLLGNIRIHLDHVFDLGNFLEFEAMLRDCRNETELKERGNLEDLVKRFGVRKSDVVHCSYIDLLQSKLKIESRS